MGFISDIVLQILSFVSENERTNIKQRQAEGIKSKIWEKKIRNRREIHKNQGIIYKKNKTDSCSWTIIYIQKYIL